MKLINLPTNIKKTQEIITGETTDFIRNLIKKILNPLKRGVTVQMPNNLKKIISNIDDEINKLAIEY